MSPPISIQENYSQTLSFQFQGSRSTFTENEYNPNLLNKYPHVLVSNEYIEKTKRTTQAFTDIYNKIYQLTKQYQLGKISIETDELYAYVFVINVPKKQNYTQILEIWDKILEDVEDYCKQKKYSRYYKTIQIVLRR